MIDPIRTNKVMPSETALNQSRHEPLVSRSRAIIQLIIFSIIGIVCFFIPFTINDKSTILFDHASKYLVSEMHTLSVTLLFLTMIYGVVKPIISSKFKESLTDMVLTIAKVAGLILGAMYIMDLAPAAIMTPDMMPFLFEKLALPVGMIVPIGALILASLVGFGLLEMIGVLLQPIMKPIWRTPGSSAIDAVASFVGSYSIGLLITNRVYLKGMYSTREAMIIATGFSTVSAAFMVIVAKTLGLMEFWNLFFWSTLIITFLVTAITARIPPISMAADDDIDVEARTINTDDTNRFAAAIDLGIETSRRANNIPKIFLDNFCDGLKMAAAIVPSIIAVGLAGLLLDKYTQVFDILGLLLYPFTWIVGTADPMEAAKGMSAGLAEMFLPALLLGEADLMTRYIAGVVSISSVLFFSAMIPCVLATKIPLSIPKMLIIWFERTALSILIAGAFGHLAVSMGWLAIVS